MDAFSNLSKSEITSDLYWEAKEPLPFVKTSVSSLTFIPTVLVFYAQNWSTNKILY